jgi:hypothetical protein
MEILHIDFYSGSKRDESPRRIFTSSGTITVDRVIETNLEEDFYSKKRKKIFVFQSQEKDFYKLAVCEDSFELKEIKKKNSIFS